MAGANHGIDGRWLAFCFANRQLERTLGASADGMWLYDQGRKESGARDWSYSGTRN